MFPTIHVPQLVLIQQIIFVIVGEIIQIQSVKMRLYKISLEIFCAILTNFGLAHLQLDSEKESIAFG